MREPTVSRPSAPRPTSSPIVDFPLPNDGPNAFHPIARKDSRSIAPMTSPISPIRDHEWTTNWPTTPYLDPETLALTVSPSKARRSVQSRYPSARNHHQFLSNLEVWALLMWQRLRFVGDFANVGAYSLSPPEQLYSSFLPRNSSISFAFYCPLKASRPR